MSNILRKISILDIKGIVLTLICIVPALIFKKFNKDIWIISERENEAKDNGFWLYSFICKTGRHDNTYYAINPKATDYSKVKHLGKTIKFGSFKHYFFTCAAEKYISSQLSSGFPNRMTYYLWLYKIVKCKFCFLQHGITMNKSKYLLQPAKRSNLFCCASEREREFIISLGYPNEAVKVTGFCRYDGLIANQPKKDNNFIFIMFTWRKYLTNCEESELKNTNYYKNIYSLINNEKFYEYCNGKKVIMVLHPGVDKFINVFTSKFENIEIVSNGKYDFSYLINNCSIFITDYSSVAFDVSYLNKPIYYFQFDEKEFRLFQQKGYYSFETDGFGPVSHNIESLIRNLNCHNDYMIYKERRNEFFKFFDQNNCFRTYKSICDIK